MEVGFKLYEDLTEEGRETFKKAQLEMALLCEKEGWCMEDGYDENGKRYLIINPPEPEHVPTQEEIEAQALAIAKRERAKAVDRLTVEVEGMVFDADEVSQQRVARSIVALQEGETMPWVLYDNTIVQVTKSQLMQVLRLAGQKQCELWVKPYTG
jgi:hypothetical protein